MPYQKQAEIVLAMWRDVERLLNEFEPGSASPRDEYQRLTQEAREHHRPDPPPMPREPTR